MERLKRDELEDVVSALTEGVIFIEPDQRITYANPAALTIHGVESLEDLGRTVDEYRARFLLRYRNHHSLKPEEYPFERVLAGEVFDQVVVEVERTGDPDQAWTHRIRSLVVTGPDEKPSYLALVIADVTEQFEAQDRFERTFAANPAPALICRLADQTFVKVNEGFLEMTGYAREDVLGHTLRDIDVFQQADRRDLALERMNAGETIPQMEANLPVLGASDKLVVVAGQPLEVQGAACMLLTFADLEPKRQAMSALKQREEQLAKLFRLAPNPMSIWRKKDRIFLDVNEAFCSVTGYTSKDIVGHSSAEISLTDEDNRIRFLNELEAKGRVSSFETRLRRKDGDELIVLISADSVMIDSDECLLCAFQDVSARKRTEAELMRAIETVMSDASWFSQAVIERLAVLRAPLQSKEAPGGTAVSDLSLRERDVLERLCRGASDPQIAEDLGVSPHTIRNHVASLFRKIGVNRRSAAIVWARDRGIGDGQPARARRRRR
ncbi:PAS domain S-box protein [Microvirga pudoricolor]|uniref:PAS domain S-box protein n=1 Tax=Microvirga pudoricolor TaxID=2778729 RepID=UPI00194FC546|nr:PAS domain S-box protein [Microvirga pudoricolor]MBM6596779.1 PAS domain S-box protein [Microvirga pudoricolor]